MHRTLTERLFGSLSLRQVDRKRKQIVELFKQYKLSITVDINFTTLDFLELSFDLTNEADLTYKKPNDISIYIHVNFNQPPSIVKELSNSISKRISSISSSEEIFDNVVLSTKLH